MPSGEVVNKTLHHKVSLGDGWGWLVTNGEKPA